MEEVTTPAVMAVTWAELFQVKLLLAKESIKVKERSPVFGVLPSGTFKWTQAVQGMDRLPCLCPSPWSPYFL